MTKAEEERNAPKPEKAKLGLTKPESTPDKQKKAHGNHCMVLAENNNGLYNLKSLENIYSDWWVKENAA